MVTQTENQLGIYSSIPADLTAVTVTTGGTFYMTGYSNGPGSSAINLAAGYKAGATTVALDATTSFYVGELVLIDGATGKAELATISAISSPNLTFTAPLVLDHADNATVVGTSAAFTPSFSGRLRISARGSLTGATGKTVQAKICVYDGTAAAGPTAGDAVGSTVIGNISKVVALTGVLTQNFACEALVGGSAATNTTPSGGAALTVGKPYLFDLALTSTSNSDTPQAKDVTWTIAEI